MMMSIKEMLERKSASLRFEDLKLMSKRRDENEDDKGLWCLKVCDV